MDTRELWKVNCARKFKDLEFHYSAGPTRCAVPSENLRLLKDDNSDVLSTSRTTNTVVSRTSATTTNTNTTAATVITLSRASQTGRRTISNGSNISNCTLDSNSGSVTTKESTTSLQTSNYSRRVKRLEKKLVSVRNERREAQELLEATTEQLNKLEELLKRKEL